MLSTQFDERELEAVQRVIKSGNLSGYIAGSLTGGPEVEALEREWEEYFGVKHAIAVNSATSGLFIAGQVLRMDCTYVSVPAFTMSASKTALLYNNFVSDEDIEEDFYCVDRFIAPATVAVDLFGQPYDVERASGFIIEDASQAIGAKYKDKYCGTLGNIGVFSLNIHKHITCGEGGIVVTDDDKLALKMRLIRNHGEVVDGNIHGLNLRMTELEAAVARVQLTKLESFLSRRLARCEFLNDNLPSEFVPKVRKDCTHVYYLYPVRVPERKAELLRALDNRLVPYIDGYNKPLADLPNVTRIHEELICFNVKHDTPYRVLENIVLAFEDVY
jgi:perosamine synthetase